MEGTIGDVASVPGPTESNVAKVKASVKDRAVDRLPDEIVQQILQASDPDSFASLVLLNSKWHRVSQQAHLYAQHLAACPSYAASHKEPPAASDEDLPSLRREFARQVKRNLFEAYLRPAETTISLVSNSISSSSSPGGDSMQFSSSPRGHHILAYSSSRIYVLDVRGNGAEVKREFKILRRPVSVCITDEASLLAVLSSEMQVDVFDLTESPPRRKQSMVLDHAPRTIALSPCGSVLAAAYEGGIEVSSLAPGALPNEKRSVKCDGVDTLAFSFDGTQLMGTTTQSGSPSTVVLTAPYYEPGNLADDSLSGLWTTSILFPNTSRDCSHAVLIQETKHEEAAWTFTYDRNFETFRAVRIDDLRNGTTYFTGPIPSPSEQVKLLPSTLPTASYDGDLISAGFQGKDVWLYGIPEDLDAVPESTGAPGAPDGLAALGRRNSRPPSRTPSSRAVDGGARPQWQSLHDKLRNTFVWGAKVAELDRINHVKWVSGYDHDASIKERLVVAARGVLASKAIPEEDDAGYVDGGRITLLDFDYSAKDGPKKEITIEVGTPNAEPLEEETRDIATEVAIVRRRTVAQRYGDPRGLLRAATTAAASSLAPDTGAHMRRTATEGLDGDDPLVPRRLGVAPETQIEGSTSAQDAQPGEGETITEAQEAVEAPYSHDNPRSTTSLHRAATAAAINRRQRPQSTVAGNVEYRRADGRAEHPHESDADNWVPPPPPYQKDDPVALPAFLRHRSVAPSSASPAGARPPRVQTAAPAHRHSAWPMPASSGQLPMHLRNYPDPSTGSLGATRPSHRRTASDSTTMSRPQTQDTGRPGTSPSAHVDVASTRDDNGDDLYDVSPPDSPRLAPQAVRHDESVRSESSLRRGVQPVTTDQESFHTRDISSSTTASQRNFSRPVLPGPAPSADVQQIPPSMPRITTNLSTAEPAMPHGRRLSNAQTWHAAPAVQLNEHYTNTGYPFTAPPTGSSNHEMIGAALTHASPPSHAPGLQSRQNPQASPSQRLSIQRVPVGGRARPESSASVFYGRQSRIPQIGDTPRQPPSTATPEDPPLIISTPSGVAGVLDPPKRPRPHTHHADQPIFAPVARHARPTASSAGGGTAVDRLDPSYVPPAEPMTNAASSSHRSLLPSWLSRSASSRNRPSSGMLTRNASRAERGAAKNMRDARNSGWSSSGAGRSKSKRKKRKSNADNLDVASSAGWTDVSASVSQREGRIGKKAKRGPCTMM